MFDVVLESLRTIVLAGILVFFIRADKDVEHGRRGYLFIKIGFLLVLFGSFMDITDNFESLNWTVIGGDTPVQAFLEKIVGYLAGFVLIAIGLLMWLPTLQTMENIQDCLEKDKHVLGREYDELTRALERENRKRRAVEASLLIAEERRMMLYEKAPVPIVHGIIGGNLVEWNTTFAEMLGYESFEELSGVVSGFGDPFFMWPYRTEAEEMLAALRAEKVVLNYEARLQRKDGTIILVRMDFTTVEDRDGVNYYFYCFAEDITERRAAEELLASSERRMKAIMDTMPIGLTLLDEKTREVVDVNAAMLSMTGYSRESLVGHQCCEFLCQRDKALCPALDEGEAVASDERIIRMENGDSLPVLKSVSRVTLDNMACLLEAFVDISEQKRLEHLKEDVDRIIAHDLKAPIIGVISACKVLLMDEDDVQGEIRDILETIEQQGRKVLRMIGMSMTVYKMEAGSYVYIPSQVNFVDVVNNVLTELDDLAGGLSVTVDVRFSDSTDLVSPSLVVLGQDILYESMVANLLKNAIEASPSGGTVVLEMGKCDTDVMRMAISNSGVVPVDIRETFFEKYATSGKSSGTGLGTYSASLVVKTVGGEIHMETSDEEGRTSVFVTLPCG
ncbi:sensor histidine kinase [Pseudodesulfovibrio nedwellii]|uniref:histidine kinase n=1 Tax=Pseudodesulfovibrio nedwellii TaxID=2973072 RepID=A0ABN6S3A4_9BACT|nr:PAS domain-containing sensor histidine kinase [Pseudodesulfovibrio nedwellii]BDQ37699.1 sensor histidine kinase [Pseudodesulfovibrio nedwellii]